MKTALSRKVFLGVRASEPLLHQKIDEANAAPDRKLPPDKLESRLQIVKAKVVFGYAKSRPWCYCCRGQVQV